MTSYLDVILDEEDHKIKCVSRVAYIAAKKSSASKEDMGQFTNELVKKAATDNYISGMCIVQVRTIIHIR